MPVLDLHDISGYILARMKYKIVFALEAFHDLRRLTARNRSIVRDAIEKRLKHEPGKISKSRVKRLRGLSRPQYRLRSGDIRVFYDIDGEAETVEILAVIPKSDAAAWLKEMGETE